MFWTYVLLFLFSCFPTYVVCIYVLILRRDARSLGMAIDNLREGLYQSDRDIKKFQELTTPIVSKVFQSGEASDWSEANDTNAVVTWGEVVELNALLESIEE